jgi:hypothetical protein
MLAQSDLTETFHVYFWPEPAVQCDPAIRPKSGVNRKFPAHAQYDAVDPNLPPATLLHRQQLAAPQSEKCGTGSEAVK